MKNFLVFITVLSLISISSCSQQNPPDNVKKEFTQKFSAAKSVKWESEKTNEWEAEFKLNGKEMTACFDSTGKWLETEAEVTVKELPAPVVNTLLNKFAGFKTDEISTIENPEMKGYEVALKNKKEELMVIISADGTVLKKESEESKKEEAVNEKDEKNEKESDEAGEKKEMKTPEKIINAFNKKFQGATSVEWGSEAANEWEAEFSMNGKKMSASFDSSAVWMVTETAITEKELPAAVINILKTDFAGYDKKLIEIYEDTKVKGFELGLNKGETSIEVIFDNAGKVIKKSDVKEEKESDEAGEKKEMKTPEKVINAFNKKFQGATSVEWGSESANEWEAEFSMNGKKMSASFDSSAVWMVTETVITEKELPATVINTLKTNFAGYDKKLIEIYEDTRVKGFEFGLKKGETSIEVILDNAGKVIKNSGMKEENEKEEKPEAVKN